MLIRTDLGGSTKESARRERFEPLVYNTATNVQKAIEAAAPVPATTRLPAASASITGLVTDVEVGINTTSTAVTYLLPSVASWATQNPGGLELTIFDLTGHATANNINFTLNGSDTFVQVVSPVVNTNFGLLKLRPVIGASNQWYVRGIN